MKKAAGRICEFLLWNMLLLPFRKGFQKRQQQMANVLDALDGVDPDVSPNLTGYITPDINQPPLITVYLQQATLPDWRSIVTIIRHGRKYRIAYPALISTEARQHLFTAFESTLPYAEFTDEGEAERRVSQLDEFENEQEYRVWQLGIILKELGYGISDGEIIQYQDDFLAAARDFRSTADGLLQTLLRAYEIDLDTLPHIGSMAVAPGGKEQGHSILGDTMLNRYKIEFLNGALLLTRLDNGQEVRVSMFHGVNGGVLHGYGFSRFIKTTPRWHHLAPLLRDDYFDARRVIAFLNEHGYWQVVPRNPALHIIGTKGLTAKI